MARYPRLSPPMGGCASAEKGGGDEAEAGPSAVPRRNSCSMIRRCGIVALAIALTLTSLGCRRASRARPASPPDVQPFNFEVVLGPNHYQIEGYVVRSREPGRLPAVLVLNGGEGDARRCVTQNADLAAILGIQVACVSIPGYGKSSGPSRLVGPQAVEAARHA